MKSTMQRSRWVWNVVMGAAGTGRERAKARTEVGAERRRGKASKNVLADLNCDVAQSIASHEKSAKA